MEDCDPWETGSKQGEPSDFSGSLSWESFQAIVQGGQIQAGPGRGEEQQCPGWLAVLHTSGLCIPPVSWCSLTFLIFPTVTMSAPTACILPRMTGRLTQTFPHWIPTSPFISLASVLWPWLKSIHLLVWHPKSRSLFACEYWCCYLSQYLTSTF